MDKGEQISDVGKMCAAISIATMAIPAFDGSPASFVFPGFGLFYYLVGTLEADIRAYPGPEDRKPDQRSPFCIESRYIPSAF